MARMYSSSSKKKTFKVAIEGNIGCGKTTLLQHFINFDNVDVHQEPVHKWRNVDGKNALALLYEDPKRWALTIQTYIQLTMMETHTLKTEKPIKMIERSIYSAKYCFVENLRASGLMPDIEYIILTKWFDWIIKNNDCDLDLIVYLRTKPEVLMERIQKRGRKEEKPIPLSYLQTLHDLHEDWLVHQKIYPLPCPVLILDGNEELPDVKKSYKSYEDVIMGITPLKT